MDQNQVSIANTATSIIASNTSRKKLIITNLGATIVYVGGDSSVTTANGYPINGSESLTINDYNGALYGIVGAGTQTVSFLEEQ